MASQTATHKKFSESVTVRVPLQMLSPSSSSGSSGIFCNRPSGCCSVPNRAKYPSNLKRSAVPVRVMFYQNERWNDFSNRVVESLRSGFVERKAVAIVEIEGSTLVFDLMRMLQTDSRSGKQRFIAWIDENGKCFFPAVFLGENLEDGSDSPNNPNSQMIKMDSRVNVHPSPVLGKRKIEQVDEDEVTSTERHRIEEDKSLMWRNVKLLREEEKPYTAGSHLFLSGMRRVDPTAAVTAIHQCVGSGPLDRARFEVFQKQVEITKAARGGSANVVQAWLGASADEIRGILTHGFGAPSKVDGAQSHGVGLHLSHLSVPHLSAGLSKPDDDGKKHAVLCRVILGNVEKVEAGSQQCYPSSVEFDTGADDPTNPKWYVVWSTNMNRHVLPVFVVSYRSSVHVPAQLGGSAQRIYSIELLISRVQSHLPPSKVQAVFALLHEFKVGSVEKDDFYKQLRSVIGDQLMLSVIQELRGQKQGSS